MRVNLSKTVHWIAFASLFLPFFYTGCDREEVVEEPQATEITETANGDSVWSPAEPLQDLETEVEEPSTSDHNTLSQRLSEKWPWLGKALVSADDTYSGFALVLDSIEYLPLFALFVFALLLVLGLIMKYLHSSARRIHVLLDLSAILFLMISIPPSWQADRLWGFWVCLMLMVMLSVIDIVLLVRSIAEKASGSNGG
jgi:hypothetical protein